MSTAEPPLFPLTAAGLEFRAGRQTLLSAVDFRLGADGCTAVLGPNGAGKTLLLRLCHGLLQPSAGAVRWGGLEPARARARQAMVFQLPALLNRSVRANVDYALKLRRVPRAERCAPVDEALARCGLAAIAERNALLLSGGERQKLALARAWATRPRVMLMDEPTSELDPLATREIEDMIRLIAAQGVRVILTTHDMAQARALADDVLFLERGRLAAHLPAAEFFARRGGDVLARFAGHRRETP